MDQEKIEKYALLVFSIHNISMFVGAINNNWSSWISVLFLVMGVINSIVVFGQHWDFKSRAMFVAFSIYLCMAIFCTQSENVLDIFIPFLGVTVLLGLYGIQKLMLISFGAISFVILYHMCIVHSFEINNADSIFKYGMPIINVYFIIFVLYFWNVKRNENSRMMGSIIRDLKIAEQGKDDFLANVSHEIRTPVNTVVGMSEVILRENLDENIKEDILNIQTSGRQLVSIVSDILDFSELQSGKMKLVEVEYNLTSTIKDIIVMSQAMSIDKDIEIIVDCDGSIPVNLIGDEQKLRRMILNLINNAIKFTNEGCIVLSFEYRKEEYGINLLITVRDTGIGINKKDIEKLFTTYNQVDTKRNRQEGGIGLGLAIVKSIVEVMGGVISVKSELQKGSEFKIVIPQKVRSYEPLAAPVRSNNYRLLTYFDVEQFKHVSVRDAYMRQIAHIADDLNIQMHMCHNISELKRRVERDFTSIVLIGINEYNKEQHYFDEISSRIKVVVLLDRTDLNQIKSSKIIKLCKPIFVGSFINSINQGNDTVKEKFTAPDAEILIVDDNLINLKVISGLLEPFNMKITLSTSVADALEKIDKKQFDLIFMDHMMPEMDGIETLKRIRNKNGLYFKEVPIIALTANSVAGAREMFLEEGFQEFIAKPVELSILERVLRTFLAPNKLIYENVTGKSVSVTEDNCGLEDFDIEQGITYCGNYENFIDVLRIHCNEGEDNLIKLSQLYDNRDWKNYTILVHSLKSSMKSVGANLLSEKARLLESAAKNSNEDFILQNHNDMIAEYERIIKVLYSYFKVDGEDGSHVDDLPVMDRENFNNLLSEFEQAAYSCDEQKMQQLLSDIEGHSYLNISTEEISEILKNKISMSDYFSAYEALKKWKEKVERKA
ncbi:MAG: ATP-binding protein [Agathobacter sp.]|nr:ATP-binding protein [Agathobacter sp.]